MKKIIITSFLSAITLFGFSQTMKVEDGKAVWVVPEQKTIFTEKEFTDQGERLQWEKKRIMDRIIEMQNELTAINLKIAEHADVKNQLGYK